MNKHNNQLLLFHEISAGGIVVRYKKDQYEIAVIKRNNMNDWTLPKGHQERNESLQETAMREVFEETGIQAEPIQYLGSFTYFLDGQTEKGTLCRTHRTVHWFLMEHKKLEVKKSTHEAYRLRWVSSNDDFSFMSYKNDQAMIKKAIKFTH